MMVTTVIPSFGLSALLRSCLTQLDVALAAAGLAMWQTVVVDNGSDVPYRLEDLDTPRTHVLRLDRRSSFSRACNAGARGASDGVLLFLNNDVLLHRQAIAAMLAEMRRPAVGLCGTRLVYPDGRIQHCGVAVDATDRFAHHVMHGRPSGTVSRAVRPYPAVTGAALMIRTDLFGTLGGFDETYPFGYEDVDLCLRAGQQGASISCAQAVDSLHLESMSNKDPNRHAASRAIFARRWAGRLTQDVAVWT